MLCKSLWIVAAAGCLFFCSAAAAQTGYEANQFHLAPDQSDNYFSVDSARLLFEYGWTAGLAFDHVSEPVRIDDPSGLTPVYAPPYSGAVVTDQSSLHLLGAFGITRWLQVGLDLPLVLHQSGENLTGLPTAQAVDSSAGIGDIRLVPKVRLFQTKATEDEDQFAAALLVDFGMPTGERERYQGGGTRLEPALALEWRSSVGFRLAGNLGYAWRVDHVVFADVEVENTFTWAAAAEFPILKRQLAALAEVYGDLGHELLLGLKGHVFNMTFTAAAGPGLGSGDTLTPDWRLVVGASYRGGSEPPSDIDGDGVVDERDRCPHDAEDTDGFEDKDGCPDSDNDGDQVPDSADDCPMDPEDIDRHNDEDGCPDPDNDDDGIVDAKDACVGEPEDRDGYQDGDGCPDPDNDNDGILDINDKCATDPEDPDGEQDEDGCPDFAPVVRVDLVVFFETNSDVVSNTAQLQLDKVAHTLIAMPNDMHVWIEGHADDRGSPQLNLELGMSRANAVRHYLRERGVPADRMTVHSYGETKELRIGKNDPDRQGNRRVEFRVGPKSFVKEEEP